MKRALFLPPTGYVTASEFCAAMVSAPRVLGLPDAVLMRVVAYAAPERDWLQFAASVLAGEGEDSPESTVVEAEPIRLVAVRGDLTELETAQGLKRFLNFWHEVLHGTVSPMPWSDSVGLSRYASNSQLHDLPCWVARIQPAVQPPTGNLPPGPFHDPKSGFFAVTLGDAAAQWLLRPAISGIEHPQPAVEMVIPDPRAYVVSIAPAEQGVIVRLRITRGSRYHVNMALTGYDEQTYRIRAVATVESGGEAHLRFPAPIRAMHGYVIGDDGFCYDQFHEDEHRRSHRGAAVLFPERPAADPEYAELRRVLERGEDEQTEVKAWLPVDRSRAKSFELLKEVCAFTNTSGGVIYVGVTDDLEVRDFTKQLIHDFGRDSGSRKTNDVEALRVSYAQAIRRVVGEGISPRLDIEARWVNHAGIAVLRIDVPRGSAPLYQIVESGDVYVRRGGSCKRITPAEWALAIAARGPAIS